MCLMRYARNCRRMTRNLWDTLDKDQNSQNTIIRRRSKPIAQKITIIQLTMFLYQS